jgi:hypothetical protein
MKKIIFLLMLLIPSVAWGQSVNVSPANITQNKNGGEVRKGDTIRVAVQITPDQQTRGSFLDFQHQTDAFTLLNVTPAPVGSQGSAFPQGATISLDRYDYPNCAFIKSAQNTTTDGWTNYINANYTCSSPGHQITRVFTNVASASPLVAGDYVYLDFQVREDMPAAFAIDSIYMNFAILYAADGSTQTTTLTQPRHTLVTLAPGENNIITGTIQLNNIPSNMLPRVQVFTAGQNPSPVANANVDISGNFFFGLELERNTNYELMVMFPGQYISELSQLATTVSDYTLAQQEFLKQNLDRTFTNQFLTNGIMYKAADVNKNNNFDGGDAQVLFNAVIGVDTIMKLPTQCSADPSSCWIGVPTATAATFDGINFETWKTMSPRAPFSTTNSVQHINIKYVFPGDTNLSHSSVPTQGAASGVASMMLAQSTGITNNTINLSLSNVVVTSNDITVPFQLNTNGHNVSGLQFEIRYDPTKVKFEKIEMNTPSWVNFVNDGQGVIRFGGVDKDFKNPIKGNVVPFKIKFSSIQPGINLNTQLTLTSNIDAADQNGRKLNMVVNSSVVNMIGANYFR